MNARIVNPTKTCAPWSPVKQKNTVGNAPSLVLKPMREYSSPCVMRKLRPIRKVRNRPARSPQTLPRFTDVSAQCIVKDDVTRMHVLTNATYTGSEYGGVGHGTSFTTRMKKYAVKNEPKSMISDPMKRNMPRMLGEMRELKYGSGGCPCSSWSRCSAGTATPPAPPPARRPARG